MQQLVRRLALQALHKTTDCRLRRDRKEKVNVIPRYMTLHDRDVMTAANLSDDFPNPNADFTGQHLPAVLGDPHHVQVDLVYRVGSMTVFFHPENIAPLTNLLKPSPKGEGFNPPSLGQ